MSYIWFKADILPGETKSVFHMYYGNPDATISESNGEAVFEFFDDFKAFSPNIWEIYPADSKNISVENGYIEISNGTTIVTKNDIIADGILEVKTMAVSTGGDTEASVFARCQKRTPDPLGSTYQLSSGSFSTDNWKNFSIAKDSTTYFISNPTPMEVDTWYLLSFQLNGGNIRALRYNYYLPTLYESLNITDFSYSSGNFGLYTTDSCRAKYDWILYHKIYPYTFNITIAAPASLYYTFTQYENLSFVDHPSVSNNLNRDDVASTHTAAMQLSIPSPGKYSVTITIGEPYYALSDINIYAENKLMISNFSTDPGCISSKWFVVNVSDRLLDLKFEYSGSHPEGFWSITSIIVEKGVKGVKLKGMG